MKLPSGDRALATLLVVPTAIVIVLLGIVQYRSSLEATRATGQRLTDSLQMSIMSWQLNVFRDLADVCLRFRLDDDRIRLRDLEQAVSRFQARQASADYADLVASIHLVPADPDALLLDWRTSDQRFVSGTATEALSRLRDQLRTTAGTSGRDARLGANESLLYTPGDLASWRFAPEVPAVLRRLEIDDVPFEGRSSGAPGVAWLTVVFDMTVLSTRVLPVLSARYFSGPDGLDHEVALVGGTPRRVLYASDEGFADEDPPDADGRMNVFGRPVDSTTASAIRIFINPEASNLPPPTPVGGAWWPLVGDAAPDADWRLVVRHRRGGPLNRFVADLYWRNLYVSFGLLLLLVTSATIWLIIGRRVRRLARLEMSFVTSVSHDLRTPLTIIASAADNMSRGVVRDLPHFAQYGTVIGTQAKKLSELVEQVLLFASVRKPATRYQLQPVAVHEVIDTTLTALDALIRAAGVTIESDIEADLPAVLSDPVGLSQCLQNLITNALKYSGDRKWVGIRAARASGGREVEVSVSDRGIGIAAADLRYVFEPFYRSPQAIALKIHGTGLGLAVAKTVAETMNSRLTVTSAPGEGSTFTLHLPAADARDDASG